MKQSLYLVDHDEPTRQQIAMAEIEQEHRDAKWVPFSEPRQSPTFDPDGVLQRSTYRVEVSRRIPLWRRLLRWLGRLFS